MMSGNNKSLKDIKAIDLVEYLRYLGFQPQKIRNADFWYLSPLREEKEASFKVNRKLNVWYDHGIGKGGNLLDFALLYHNCSFKEVIQLLNIPFSFHPHIKTSDTAGNQDEKGLIKISDIREIHAPGLAGYLSERKIPLDVARCFCKEVEFILYDKKHTALGFENNSGGFELRNPYFKGSSSPKAVTLISNNSEDISVFEGFFSFLSFHVLHQKHSQPLTNFLVLNSLSFFERSRLKLEEHNKIHLYLDRDQAGMKLTHDALKWNLKYIDKSNFYKNYKDINEYLVHKSLKQECRYRLRNRF